MYQQLQRYIPHFEDGTPAYVIDKTLKHIINNVEILTERCRTLRVGERFSQQESQLLWDTYTKWSHWREETSTLTTLHFALYKKLQEVEFGLPQTLKDKIYTKRKTVWAY